MAEVAGYRCDIRRRRKIGFRRLKCRSVAVYGKQATALCRKSPRDGVADAAGCAGDHDGLAGKRVVRVHALHHTAVRKETPAAPRKPAALLGPLVATSP